ncbi:hypothetical protein ACQKQC_06400 [Vibrio fortis]|uniref:hypothetical protein n=1 Tax=Vibrio fortis TaxID=212667 RepID=UPI0040693C67
MKISSSDNVVFEVGEEVRIKAAPASHFCHFDGLEGTVLGAVKESSESGESVTIYVVQEKELGYVAMQAHGFEKVVKKNTGKNTSNQKSGLSEKEKQKKLKSHRNAVYAKKNELRGTELPNQEKTSQLESFISDYQKEHGVEFTQNDMNIWLRW